MALKIRGFLRSVTLALAFNVAAVSPLFAQRLRDDKPDRYASIVIEETTGKVLYERDAAQQLHPASTTKLMTAYLVFRALESGKLAREQELPVSAFAAGQPSTNLFMMKDIPIKKTVTGKDGRKRTIVAGTEKRQMVDSISVENALRGMLCHSANDAAVVFAESIGGSQAEFVRLMNEEAQRLGMKHTVFTNPNGLPDTSQHTTVEDMARLARALIEDFPDYYEYFSIRTFNFNGHVFHNTNKLLGAYVGLDGLKTGWIASSGFNLVASAERNDQRVIGIVFGAARPEERNEDMRRLLDFAFQKLKNPKAVFVNGLKTPAGERYVELPPREAPPDSSTELKPPAPKVVFGDKSVSPPG